MLAKGDRVLACVSGGADSVFMLCALCYLKEELGVDLKVAHLDHGLRGKESDGDRQYVKALAEKYNIPFISKKINLKKIKKQSIEESARAARYDFFYAAAKSCRANKIATAHTRDDQSETVLMRVIKGSSLKGLSGIPAVRTERGVTIIRPLIDTEKKDAVGYLKEKKIAFRVDRSNYEDVYFRNVVRNKIIPYLERYNPRIKRTLADMAASLREDLEFIGQARPDVVSARVLNNEASMSIRDIALLPRAVQREIFRDTLSAVGGSVKKLSFRHWKAVELLINSCGTGKVLELPGHVTVSKKKDRLVFARNA
jgi:tRNA(Ile)-lysidine synthase